MKPRGAKEFGGRKLQNQKIRVPTLDNYDIF